MSVGVFETLGTCAGQERIERIEGRGTEEICARTMATNQGQERTERIEASAGQERIEGLGFGVWGLGFRAYLCRRREDRGRR